MRSPYPDARCAPILEGLVLEFAALVDRKSFRDAMARLGSAVNVITTASPTGPYGLTASAVCSVTDDPPMLLHLQNKG